MSWFSEWLSKLGRTDSTEGEPAGLRDKVSAAAADAAARAAATAAKASAQKVLSGVAESFVGFAERELERATAERGAGEPREPGEQPPSEPAVEVPRPPTASEREASARAQLERLKAERGRS
ncbi:MAG: hypothetical protein ABMA64_26345 [Myxococcota bacterium]